MNKQEAIQQLLNATTYFEQQSAGYKSWGKVAVLQIAIRLDTNEIISTDINKELSALTEQDISSENIDSLYCQIFAKRKKVQVILLTKQEYAAEVKEEIPPILDDQAQLLGVSVKVVNDEHKIISSLSGRFATILGCGRSICLGTSLEDAYVAAQLLEKTSKAFIEAKYLGGAKSINKIEAWLMQQFYQFKYSKEAKKNK
jgi:ribulose-5-phosphate 4-epimerase/fuculose-1-phosphate aldolase